MACSERLSKTDEPSRQGFLGAAVHLESQVESNRSERRLVADAAADVAAQFAEIEIAGAREHVPLIDESDHAEAARHRRAELGVEDDESVAANRDAVIIERLLGNPYPIQRKAADRRVASREEPFARGKLFSGGDT